MKNEFSKRRYSRPAVAAPLINSTRHDGIGNGYRTLKTDKKRIKTHKNASEPIKTVNVIRNHFSINKETLKTLILEKKSKIYS